MITFQAKMSTQEPSSWPRFGGRIFVPYQGRQYMLYIDLRQHDNGLDAIASINGGNTRLPILFNVEKRSYIGLGWAISELEHEIRQRLRDYQESAEA